MTGTAMQVLEDNCNRFAPEIAQQAYRGHYDRLYELVEANNDITASQPKISVYQYQDSCFFHSDDLDWAYDIDQFTVHEIVRELLDQSNLVLSYIDTTSMSESKSETLGLGGDE